ncbi:hypothetical protein [Aurantiacibacter luteus]|uniref:hypothetical protein n=1 Tax=Aurantiacibacter luteus TaxID=1581420 RepID=UPI0019D3B59B|nr:hypothetical protein [Aurantiacibacter luteus]
MHPTDNPLQIVEYIDVGTCEEHATHGLIDSIILEHYSAFEVTRARIISFNRTNHLFLKKRTRRKADPTEEKLFKSLKGASGWAISIMKKAAAAGHNTRVELRINPITNMVVNGEEITAK